METEEKDIAKSKQTFIDLFNTHIKREGSENLLNWLLKSDFFIAPASTKFHSAYLGGLCDHSIKAYKRFLFNIEKEYGKDQTIISQESIAICGLLHDVCKANYYATEMRNVKENGAWIQKPYFIVQDQLPYGHGEKSVYIISSFIKLTREESMAINWHMGGFDTRVMGGSYSLSGAFYQYPTSLIFHVSDLESTYLDENA